MLIHGQLSVIDVYISRLINVVVLKSMSTYYSDEFPYSESGKVEVNGIGVGAFESTPVHAALPEWY